MGHASTVVAVPFPDELQPVNVVDYQERWRDEFLAIAHEVRALDLSEHGTIEHIGSTAIPGLAAKDVVDVQVRVDAIDDGGMTAAFARRGYRRRVEAWNNVEETRTGNISKLVFAPPADSRRCNIHVRTDGTTGARDALLFRDCLRQDAQLRDAWGSFKIALAASVSEGDLLAYGRVKQPVWSVLMRAADVWANETGWHPQPIGHWQIQ
jgi:dephospho-CoA kinase